jgi:YD repeat-containing protein
VTVATTTVYDGQNRVIQTVEALGNTNRTFYNTLGKVDYTIDAFGNTNSFLYDALGNLIQTTYPNGTFTRTVYDSAGRTYLTTDRNGITGTRTDYDAAGRATNTVRLTNVVVNIVYNGSVAQSTVNSAGLKELKSLKPAGKGEGWTSEESKFNESPIDTKRNSFSVL